MSVKTGIEYFSELTVYSCIGYRQMVTRCSDLDTHTGPKDPTSYGYIGSFVEWLTDNMKLKKTQMTFYYNHAHIDNKHAKNVEEILLKVCKTDDDWKQVGKVATATTDITHNILSAELEEYHK